MSGFVETVPDKPTIPKDPDAILDYGWDFSDLIDPSDPITNASFPTVTGGITIDSGSVVITNNVVYAFVHGGTPGETASGTCRYVTAAGRSDDRTLYFKIRDR